MIDKKIQQNLRLKYSPDGSELRKMQLRMLEMLRYIDGVCAKYNIPYWLSSGTCLGAIRHGGFIPWDDDVDIELLDNDYERLRKILLKECHPEFAFHDHSTDSSYINTFGKLRDLKTYLTVVAADKLHAGYKYKGCSIDIFPMTVSNSRKIFNIGSFLNKLLIKTAQSSFVGSNLINRFLYFSIHYFLAPILNSISSIGESNRLRHKLPNSFVSPRYKSDIFPLRKVKFEDTSFYVPGNYDKYLQKIYGRYMDLPSENSIKVHITNVEFL